MYALFRVYSEENKKNKSTAPRSFARFVVHNAGLPDCLLLEERLPDFLHKLHAHTGLKVALKSNLSNNVIYKT